MNKEVFLCLGAEELVSDVFLLAKRMSVSALSTLEINYIDSLFVVATGIVNTLGLLIFSFRRAKSRTSFTSLT